MEQQKTTPTNHHHLKRRLASMRLRTKFLVLTGMVIIISFGVTFYRTSEFQNELLIGQAERQARMLAKQLVLTRKWVAEHNGVFVIQKAGMEANPFLDIPQIRDDEGQTYVKRNPAMVTRELSEMASLVDFCRFRVTSLTPLNPANKPDDFERQSLESLEQGTPEMFQIQRQGKSRILRYIAPLTVEQSCLECHVEKGYQPGDIRGGLSITIPIAWADQAISRNNRMLVTIAGITVCVVSIAIYLLIETLVVRRLNLLARAMELFPDQAPETAKLPKGADEISTLAIKFRDLGKRLLASQDELEKTREQMYQAEKMAALGRLAAGIAHEVNNPLGGMRNCVKSIIESPDDREMLSRYLALLDKGLRRIEKTMRKLLNFGRIEKLKIREVAINDLVEECFALLEYRLKNIKQVLDLQLTGTQLVDVESMKQIIMNIALNSVQAMPGGGTITVSTTATKDRYLIRFSDTGPGIAAEHLPYIFDPFFTTKDIGEGTGLGLAVTYSLVKRLGGSIDVENNQDKGCSFLVAIPKDLRII
jgi:two-component system NtrC family sensor kinase